MASIIKLAFRKKLAHTAQRWYNKPIEEVTRKDVAYTFFKSFSNFHESIFKNLKVPQAEEQKTIRHFIDFSRENELNKFIIRSDKELGGYSNCSLIVDPERNVGVFEGDLSLKLPKENPKVQRSGYAMFRTKEYKPGLLEESYIDWNIISHLVLRVRGDRRKYYVNIQSNTPINTDIFQHRLFLANPGEWETVFIPLENFVLTNWGEIQNTMTMNTFKIRTVGIGILDRQNGPFKIEVAWIKAMTGKDAQAESERSRRGLKEGHGLGSALPPPPINAVEDEHPLNPVEDFSPKPAENEKL